MNKQNNNNKTIKNIDNKIKNINNKIEAQINKDIINELSDKNYRN